MEVLYLTIRWLWYRPPTKSFIPGDYKFIEEKHDVVDNIESVVYLGLNDDIIWPGNLVKGTRAYDFIYDPISIKRAPVTISISLESSTTGSSITQTVVEPKLSTIRQGISDLLKKSIVEDTHVPAKVDFKYEQINHEEEMSLFVGADVSYGAGSLKTKFNWDSTTKKNKIMAVYRQIYYSIDIDTPRSPVDFFDPSVKIDQIRTAIPEGSLPLYVSSVSYGMMALMFIETDYSEEEIKAALDVAYNAFVDAKLDVDVATKDILQSSSIKIVVYGGSTAGLQDLETGYTGFKKVIEASSNFGPDSPGVPIIYKFRHLSDNTLALVTLTSQYTLVRPIQIQQRVRVTVDKFVCFLSDDEGSNNKADMDRFKVWLDAFSRKDMASSPVQINQVGQVVYEWSTSNDKTMGVGSIHYAGGYVDLVFDTEIFDFNLSEIKLKAYGREYDKYTANESAYGYFSIPGDMFFDDGGKHYFLLTDDEDFGFYVWITIEPLD